MQEKYFGIQGENSKFVINFKKISLRQLRLIIKSPAKATLIFIFFKIRIFSLFKKKVFRLKKVQQDFIEQQQSNGLRFLFLCRGGDHCFGKDSYVFSCSSKQRVVIYQWSRSVKSQMNLERFYHRISTMENKMASFDLPSYCMVEYHGQKLLKLENSDRYTYQSTYSPEFIIQLHQEISAMGIQSQQSWADYLTRGRHAHKKLVDAQLPISHITTCIEQLLDYLDARRQSEFLILYRSHGDFTRWNIMQDDVTFRALVIDWEWVDERTEHYDLCHYLVNLQDMAARDFAPKLGKEHFLSQLSHYGEYEVKLVENDYFLVAMYLLAIIIFFSETSFLNSDFYGEADIKVIGNYVKFANALLELA